MAITVKDLIEKYQNINESEELDNSPNIDSVKVSLLGKTAVLEEEEFKVFAAFETGVITNKILNERRQSRNHS